MIGLSALDELLTSKRKTSRLNSGTKKLLGTGSAPVGQTVAHGQELSLVTQGSMSHHPLCVLWPLNSVWQYTLLSCLKSFLYLVSRDSWFSPDIPDTPLLSLPPLPNSSDQIRSVSQSCLTFCDPMNCSMPGLPVHQQLPEFTQTHVHWASDAIQPSHPLSSPSPPAPNPSQHQSLFQWVNSSHEVTKGLEFQL